MELVNDMCERRVCLIGHLQVDVMSLSMYNGLCDWLIDEGSIMVPASQLQTHVFVGSYREGLHSSC